jgi:hypothetical protein
LLLIVYTFPTAAMKGKGEKMAREKKWEGKKIY